SARLQLQRTVQFLQGFLPAPLASINVSSQKRNARFVREGESRGSQFLLGPVVIPICPIKVLSKRQMSLAGGSAQAADRLNGCFGKLNACICVVETEEIHPVMGTGELIIRTKEGRIARDSLVEKLHSV